MQIASSKVNKNGKKTMLLKMLANLSKKEQIEIHYRLSQWLNKLSTKDATVKLSMAQNSEFFKTELGQYILAEADANISIEKVRKALGKVKVSLSQEIIAEREER